MPKPTVVIAGLGDTGILVATRLARSCRVVAVTTCPALVSGQELGVRLADPPTWRRYYFVPLERFRRLAQVDVRHGRIVVADLDASTVCIESVDGSTCEVGYSALVIATGVSNGFWRDDRVESANACAARMQDDAQRLADARVIAVVGGGATGVGVADNLARRADAEVHLFVSGDRPLPGHHPSAQQWITRMLGRHGVTLHTGYRAALPGGSAPDRITAGPIEWSSGQPPFEADAVVWAVGAVRPHSAFLPAEALDDADFVRVDRHLQVPRHPNVFALGDVAASDPLRSSARNWGHRVVVANVRSVLRGRRARRVFRAPSHRWGSVLGLQREGLTVVSPKGRRFRVPRRIAEPLLYRFVVGLILYRGLRRADPAADER
ncbi:MAG: FAD-dependent oxidoreductase [Ilumatobacteraceae bacterium]